MKKFRSVLCASLLLAISFAFALSVQAQATRTWVSGVGDDANPCSRTAPCKTFAGAISKTSAGGEISVYDPGGYGAVTITKSITIDGTGTLASILGAGVNAITINITGEEASKTVRLRGLSLNGAGTGLNGIKVIAANRVIIEDLVIDGFKNDGLNIETAAAAQVFVKHTTIRNNGGAGINVVAGKGQVAISDVMVVFNDAGLAAPGGTVVSFKNNIVTANRRDGEPSQFGVIK